MGFYALGAAGLFALILPTVLLYFLKLKRPRQTVPSLVLWAQVLADNRVNSPFQKFKRNILLLLQLILLCLLVLGAMQPYLAMGPESADRTIILLDTSASMAALDQAGGKTRLEAAKEKVREMINLMGYSEQINIITFGQTARPAVAFTDNKRILRETLDQIEVEDVPSDIGDALRIAGATANNIAVDRVVLLTDGNIPETVDFDLPFELEFQKVEPAGPNIGITGVTARRNPGQGWHLFTVVETTEEDSVASMLEVHQDGQKIHEERVLGGGGQQRFQFRIDSENRSSVSLHLKPEEFDSLAADNDAFIELATARDLHVYVSPSLLTFRLALRGMPGLVVYPAADGSGSRSEYDLMIVDFDDQIAAEAPTKLLVGKIPSPVFGVLEEIEEPTDMIDWRRGSPLLDYVNLRDTYVGTSYQFKTDRDESSLENLGFEVIVYGQNGPLMLEHRKAGQLEYHMLFHPDRSQLRFRVGFPIMVSNLIKIAMHEANLLEVPGNRTGILPNLANVLLPQTQYTITGPASYNRSETTNDDGLLPALPAPKVGVYTLEANGQTKATVGVSLLYPFESLLRKIDSLMTAETTVEAATTEIETDRPLWLLLTWLALAMLFVEWWFYQKRPGGIA